MQQVQNSRKERCRARFQQHNETRGLVGGDWANFGDIPFPSFALRPSPGKHVDHLGDERDNSA